MDTRQRRVLFGMHRHARRGHSRAIGAMPHNSGLCADGDGENASDGIIVMLVPPRHFVRENGDGDWCCLLRALRSLRHVDDGGRTPVRLFHDLADRASSSQLAELVAAAAPRRACAAPIELSRLPLRLSLNTSWNPPPTRPGQRSRGCALRAKQPPRPSRSAAAILSLRPPSHSRLPHSHMVRFFFHDIFQPGVLPASARFWWRLDSDAEFVDTVGDPFEPLHRTVLTRMPLRCWPVGPLNVFGAFIY